MENNKFGFKVINFNKGIEAPVFKEARNGMWIEYGAKNSYPMELLDTFHNKSNKHKAIINRKAKMVGGNGFDKENISPELEMFYKNIGDKDTLDAILGKISYDFEIYGGFALVIKWTNNGEKIGSIKYMPFSDIRVSTAENKYWHSNDWSAHRKQENTPVEIQGYDPTISKDEPLQILYYSEYKPGNGEYPIPNYSSTLTWIESDWEISNFHLSSIQNGFSAGFILNFATGVPTEDEMELAYKEFQKKYTGSGNAGKFILTFSDGQENAPELSPIELSTSDERFIMLSEQIRNEIFIGHQVTNPQLFGVMVPGSLGGKAELTEALEIFQAVYVNDRQTQIENVFDDLSNVNDITDKVTIKKYTI